MRPIDADLLPIQTVGICDAHGNMYGAADVVFAYEIINAPTIDPVKHGRWLINPDGYYPYCSECKHEPEGRKMTKFCPNCGAKMDADSRPAEEVQHDD